MIRYFEVKYILRCKGILNEGIKHVCPLCNISYAQPHNLKKHMADVHENTHQCSQCGEMFKTKDRLEGLILIILWKFRSIVKRTLQLQIEIFAVHVLFLNSQLRLFCKRGAL